MMKNNIFQKLKTFVSKKTEKEETVFTVFAPPALGYYKLVVFAARVPRGRERVSMPVVATFLVSDSAVWRPVDHQ